MEAEGRHPLTYSDFMIFFISVMLVSLGIICFSDYYSELRRKKNLLNIDDALETSGGIGSKRPTKETLDIEQFMANVNRIKENGMTENITYADKDLLTKLNIKAINTQRNRYIDPETLREVLAGQPSNTVYPAIFTMIHNDDEMRVSFSLGDTSIWIDMDFEDYASLPEISVILPKEGSNDE